MLAQPGRLSQTDLIAAIDNGTIDTVINAIVDMQGRLVGKRVAGWYFRDHALEQGTHFCTYLLGNDTEMNTPEGFALMNWESGYGDFLARPDWSTARTIPWLPRTALLLADAVDEQTGMPVPVAPRTVLAAQIDRLAARGLSAKTAVELEFYLFDQTYESARASDYRDLQPAGWYSEDYQILQGTKHEAFYGEVRNQLIAAGIPIESSKGEDAGGQHELNIHFAEAMESADRAVLLKHGLKEMAHLARKAVSFMPKLDENTTGSSSHVHLSLWDQERGENVFATADGSPTDLMRWFVAGLVEHTRDLALLYAPTVNSYKRYAPGSWAPVNLLWARDNRTVGLRVVGSGSALRIENRFPGSDANPYLSFAAIIAAGLDGIERQLEPPAEFHGNGYDAPDAERIPSSLHEAIDCWATSEIAKGAFGIDVRDHYLNAARVELAAFERAVTDWERIRYFERW